MCAIFLLEHTRREVLVLEFPIRTLVVFGTRPEAIKLAPLVSAMRSDPRHFECNVCVTGQHREMLNQVLDAFEIQPDSNLDVMAPKQSLNGLTARVLEGLDAVIDGERPELVVVQGDTTTAFAAALAAFNKRVAIAHVEAGLRTGDMANPFPEEANRVLIDRLASFCFAPTDNNRQTLIAEGVDEARVVTTGNTGIDALLWMRERATSLDSLAETLSAEAAAAISTDSPMVLLTLHRRESFGGKMEGLLRTVAELAADYPQWLFLYPVHLNPNVLEPARSILGASPNVFLETPQPYTSFVSLMDRATIIVTDSGGVQEEAPSLGKPVIVLRKKTERQEAVDAGTVLLAGTDADELEATARPFLDAPESAVEWLRKTNPYGDGTASVKILSHLREARTRGEV